MMHTGPFFSPLNYCTLAVLKEPSLLSDETYICYLSALRGTTQSSSHGVSHKPQSLTNHQKPKGSPCSEQGKRRGCSPLRPLADPRISPPPCVG